MGIVTRNTHILARALAMHMYNLTYEEQEEVFTNDLVRLGLVGKIPQNVATYYGI